MSPEGEIKKKTVMSGEEGSVPLEEPEHYQKKGEIYRLSITGETAT